jgi:hypothetical protein
VETAVRTWQARSLAWRQEAVARLRDALSPEALAALEDGIRGCLIAEGTPPCALDVAGRVAVDKALDMRATLPACAVWREAQATPRAAVSGEAGTVVPADGGARHAS